MIGSLPGLGLPTLEGNHPSLSPHGRLSKFMTGCLLVPTLLRGLLWAPAEAAAVFSWSRCLSAPHVGKRNAVQK